MQTSNRDVRMLASRDNDTDKETRELCPRSLRDAVWHPEIDAQARQSNSRAPATSSATSIR